MCSLGFKIEGNPSCHVCGIIMVRKHKEHCGEKAFRKRTEPLGVYVEMPCDCGHPWICTSCGATTGCTEVKDGEK